MVPCLKIMEEPELTEQQKTALRKAIGDIIGDYTPWVLIMETTPLGETDTAYSESVTDPHSSAFTIIGLLDNELTQRLN